MAKIYVSSTRLDLETERAAVIDWLTLAGHQPVHSYVADNSSVRESCLRDVEKCDALVLLIGHRYGHVPKDNNPEQLSITELEYRTATKHQKPCVVLTPRGVSDITHTDLLSPPLYAKVQAFHALVANERRLAIYGDKTELIGALSAGVQRALDTQAAWTLPPLPIAPLTSPLTSLEIVWTFSELQTDVISLLCQGEQEVLDYVYEAQGRRSGNEVRYLRRLYVLYPFLVHLCRDLATRSRQLHMFSQSDERANFNVLAIFALDDEGGVVLPFGTVDPSLRWTGPTGKRYTGRPKARGIELHNSFDGSDIRSWPEIEVNEDSVDITWILEPYTLERCLAKQSARATPNIALPEVLRIAILADVEELPFEQGNLAVSLDDNYWNDRGFMDMGGESDIFDEPSILRISSIISLTPNKLQTRSVVYKLARAFETMFLDEYGEGSPFLRTVVLEYERF